MLGSYVGAVDPNSSAACEALALPTELSVQPFSTFVTSSHSVAQAGLELATHSSPPASTSQMLEHLAPDLNCLPCLLLDVSRTVSYVA